VESPDRSTIWPYRDGEPGEFYYQRYAHPTGVEAERALGKLEGGEALLFPSGSAAITALVLAELEPGQTIALAEGAYYGTGALFASLESWGLRFEEFDQTGPPPAGADLVWLEAPSNPFLTMPDFEAAATHPARVVVDSTAATPVYLRPLEHGADYVVHSATKYLGGHHDLLLGAVVCRDTDAAARLRELRGRTGIVATADRAPDGHRRRARRAAAPVPGGRAGALSRLRRVALVRRHRGRKARRDIAEDDHERD